MQILVTQFLQILQILDSEDDVPTTSSHKQLQYSAIFFNGDGETSIEEEENSEPESSDDKTIDIWCKLIKNQAMGVSLEPQV
jgi:hypothetical protein